MRWIGVLPWIYKPYFDDCVATMHPEFKRNVLCVDNSRVNRGIMWAHNQGIKRMLETEADWLVIIGASIRFGAPGGLDFIKVLAEKHDFYVIHAATANVKAMMQQRPEGADEINGVFGWHLTAFSRSLIEEVGGWDLNFSPYSLCDIDMSLRIQSVKKGASGWDTFPVEVADMGMAHGLKFAKDKIEATYEPRDAYFKAKWGRGGGEWQVPVYRHPFNDQTKPISWWPVPPDERAYAHPYWGLFKEPA